MQKKDKYLLILLLFLFQRVVFSQFSDSKVTALGLRLDSIIAPVRDAGITVSTKVIHAD